MTTSSKQTSDESVEAQAAKWVLRREEGALSAQERSALEAWLAADSRHRTAYRRLKEAWQFSAGLKSWRPVEAPINADLLVLSSVTQRRAKRARRVWDLALAASVVLVFAIAWTFLDASETYATRIGGYQRIVLDDGSVLQLNTNSKVRVHFSAQARVVRLLRGEAYFDVVRDPNRPFDVTAGDTTVRAVGTAFAVRLREAQRVEVLVTQGRVTLSAEHTTAPQTGHPSAGANAASPPLLSAGDSAETKATGLRVTQVQNEELERRLAWQTGRLHFQKETLAVVVAEFNRYNRRQLEIADPALAGLYVHGNFKATDLDSFVAAVQDALKLRVEQTYDTIRLLAE
jgi:transmembrane sensor